MCIRYRVADRIGFRGLFLMVEFGNIQVIPGPQSTQSIQAKLEEVFGPRPYTYWGEQNPKDYSVDVTAKETQKLIADGKKSKDPFFIWWSVAAPHREDVATTLMGRPGADPSVHPRFADEVDDLRLPRPPNFNEEDISDKPSSLQNTAPSLSEDQIASLEEDYRGRIGSLLAVDEHVGKMVDKLKDTGQLKDTMIMFVSDNGWQQGEHRITGDKFLPYEESLRTPMILRGPGVKRGRTISEQVSNIDFAPTLVDAAGAKAGRKLDGVSLLPAAGGRDVPSRVLGIEAPYPLFAGDIPVNRWDRPYRGVRTERYTYVVWDETGEEELYDRDLDPFQLANVAADPAYAQTKALLATQTDQLDDCAGKACTVRP